MVVASSRHWGDCRSTGTGWHILGCLGRGDRRCRTEGGLTQNRSSWPVGSDCSRGVGRNQRWGAAVLRHHSHSVSRGVSEKGDQEAPSLAPSRPTERSSEA